MVTGSAVAYSTAGYFTRLIDLDVWTVLFWRGLYAGLAILAFIGWQHRRRTLAAFDAVGLAGIVVALCSALATIAFINAFRLTSVADVMAISATIPFLTAAMAWMWTRERTGTATLIASGAAFLGVVITISGARTPGHFLGALLALAMALCLAAMTVVIRRRRDISMLPATCLSAFLCAALVLPMAVPGAAQQTSMLLLALFGVAQLGLGLTLLTLGARRLPASRSALIGCLDVPLAAFWVWLAFGEVPSIAAGVGGAIVMAAVVGEIVAKGGDAGRPAWTEPEPER